MSDAARKALLDYRQADEEGIIVFVSRQAIHELVDAYDSLKAEEERLRAALSDISATEWEEDEPATGWCPEHAEGYVQEMEAFANWIIQHSAKALKQEGE